MTPTQIDAVDLQRCHACDLVWIRPADLERLVQATERRFVAPDLRALDSECQARRRQASARTFAGEAVDYSRCPECGEVMLRRAFGGISGIVSEHCAAHGSRWRAADLERVRDFLRRGGELLVLQDRVEQLEARTRELEVRVQEADQRRRGDQGLQGFS